jgi:hypothetical protein
LNLMKGRKNTFNYNAVFEKVAAWVVGHWAEN